jgi:short-subunit dehydrogenase
MTELNNALVLITGASGGFGRHMTEQFLEAGSRLILSDIDPSTLASLAATQKNRERILGCVDADLAGAAGARRLYDQVLALGSAPDIIVNNAGIGVGGRFDHVPADRWEQVVELDLLAPMRLCYLFLPHMLAKGSGHLVNISSLAGWIGAPGIASYSAAKFGLRGFGDAIAEDYADAGVNVSTVYPFFSRTPILNSEQFGIEERREVPDALVTDPADVVAEIIKGVQKNRRDIFPDKMSRRLHYLKRFSPWIIRLINRRMRAKMNVSGQV